MTIRSTSQSRSAKAKGRAAENEVVAYLREHGYPAERRRLTGDQDCGDIGGIPGLCMEVKAGKSIELSKWLDETVEEQGNCMDKYSEDTAAALVIKRRRRSVGDWYVVMTLNEYMHLMGEGEQ